MNVFRSLREYLKFLAGVDDDDSAEPAPEKKQAVVRPAPVRPIQRAPSSQGDGFDAGPGRRVDLRGGVKVPVLEAEEPQPLDADIVPNDFNASLDDLPVLLDEPLEPQAEFIPEGGMSTESLMREFTTLDPEVVAAAVSLSPDGERVGVRGLGDEPQVATAEGATTEAASTPAESAQSSSPEPASTDSASATAAPALVSPLPVRGEGDAGAIDLAEFATPESTFAFDSSSLAESAFESEPVEAAPLPAQPVFDQSLEESSFTPADPSRVVVKKPERGVPAWLVPATTAAAPKVVPSGPDFNASLDDLGLLVPEPEAPEAPESKPSPQPSPPRGDGSS